MGCSSSAHVRPGRPGGEGAASVRARAQRGTTGGDGAGAAASQQPHERTKDPQHALVVDKHEELPIFEAGPILDRVTDVIGENMHLGLQTRLCRNKNVWAVYQVSKTVLGTGLNGSVRKCIHRTTGHAVALKTLDTSCLTQRKRSMLINEVRIYLELDHPGITKLLEVYEDDNSVHMVMEIAEGRELYDRLIAKRSYGEGDCASAMFQMLDVVRYMHTHGIVHRDLKLENFVYTTSCATARLRVIDLGFAAVLQGKPLTAVHGTVYYVAPEVLEGGYDSKCDVWSLGVIAFMLLSGSPPFNGDTDAEISAKIMLSEFSMEGVRWTHVSNEAKQFVRRALTRQPAKRPSADEMIADPWIQEHIQRRVANASDPNASPDRSLANGSNEPGDDRASLSKQVLEDLKAFASKNILQRAACSLVAFNMTASEVDHLEEVFKQLDVDKTGTLTLQDVTQALAQELQMAPDEAAQVFSRLDQTKNNEIHYSEFVAACLQHKIVRNERLIQVAFEKLDVDSSGKITSDNLRTVLGDSYNGTPVEEIVAQLQSEAGGEGVTYDAFFRMLTGRDKQRADSTSVTGAGAAATSAAAESVPAAESDSVRSIRTAAASAAHEAR